MCKRILSASVSVQEGTPSPEFRFHPGINVLFGQSAEDVVLALAGIFGGISRKAFEAVLDRQDGVTLFVTGADGIKREQGEPAQLMKDFHKQRFLKFGDDTHLLDGSQLPAGTSGASRLMLEKLAATLARKDDRPLFVCSFLERLDEAIDLRPIFEALRTTGRQVFIAVPHDYDFNTLEGMYYDTAICCP